jgi:hypothetical protein
MRCRYLDAVGLQRPSALTLQEHHELGSAASQVKLNMWVLHLPARPPARCAISAHAAAALRPAPPRRALCRLKLLQPQPAAELAGAVLYHVPGHAKALYILGRARLQQRRYAAAARHLAASLAAGPGDVLVARELRRARQLGAQEGRRAMGAMAAGWVAARADRGRGAGGLPRSPGASHLRASGVHPHFSLPPPLSGRQQPAPPLTPHRPPASALWHASATGHAPPPPLPARALRPSLPLQEPAPATSEPAASQQRPRLTRPLVPAWRAGCEPAICTARRSARRLRSSRSSRRP